MTKKEKLLRFRNEICSRRCANYVNGECTVYCMSLGDGNNELYPDGYDGPFESKCESVNSKNGNFYVTKTTHFEIDPVFCHDFTDRIELFKVHKESDYSLCFVENSKQFGVAFFTQLENENQSGDNWDVVPYGPNASYPHGDNLIKVRFVSKLKTPEQIANFESHYSVNDINGGAVAWLYGDGVAIYAGTSIDNFKSVIVNCGGSILGS